MLNPVFSLATAMEGIAPSPAWLQSPTPGGFTPSSALGASGWSLDVPIAQLFMDAAAATPGCGRHWDVRWFQPLLRCVQRTSRAAGKEVGFRVCVPDTGDGH